jgi:hypothetical protein
MMGGPSPLVGQPSFAVPWPLPVYLPPQATCPHCYCNEAPDATYRTGPHRACCKCGDTRAVRFLADGAGFLPAPEGGEP